MGHDNSHVCKYFSVGVDMLLVKITYDLINGWGFGLPRAANWRLLGQGRTREDLRGFKY